MECTWIICDILKVLGPWVKGGFLKLSKQKQSILNFTKISASPGSALPKPQGIAPAPNTSIFPHTLMGGFQGRGSAVPRQVGPHGWHSSTRLDPPLHPLGTPGYGSCHWEHFRGHNPLTPHQINTVALLLLSCHHTGYSRFTRIDEGRYLFSWTPLRQEILDAEQPDIQWNLSDLLILGLFRIGSSHIYIYLYLHTDRASLTGKIAKSSSWSDIDLFMLRAHRLGPEQITKTSSQKCTFLWMSLTLMSF